MVSWTILKNVLDLGWARAPQVTRLAIGALVVFVVATAILSLGLAPSVLFPSVVGILIVGFITSLVSQMLAAGPARGLGILLAWAIVIAFIALLCLFTASAFTNWIPRGSIIVARVMNAPELVSGPNLEPVVVDAGQRVTLNQIRHYFPVELPAERFDQIKALSERPTLVVRSGGVLLIGDVGGNDVLAVHTLRLEGGAIITGGANFNLTVVRLVSSGNGAIRSFENPSTPAPGIANGTVTLTILDRIDGVLSVDLAGRSGMRGENGHSGLRGAAGAPGDNAASSLFDCKRGAGPGGRGGPGQPGGAGGDGGPGGNGGNLQVVAPMPDLAMRFIQFSANGGAGGAGGAGGPGGQGGDGGPGGSARGLCSGSGSPGPSGPPGPNGSAGRPGKKGNDGTATLRALGAS